MATTLVTAFGRFQPPTKGHQEIFDVIVKQARRLRGDAMVFVSPAQNTKNSPLTHRERVRLLRRGVPQIKSNELEIGPETIKTPYDMLSWAKKRGYTTIMLVAGVERKNSNGGYTFRDLVAGWSKKEDPDGTVSVVFSKEPSTRVGGISGTQARNFARYGNIEEFEDILLPGLSLQQIEDTMQLIQSRMGALSESRRYLPFLSYVGQLLEAEDDDPENERILKQASKEAAEKDETLPQPDDTPVSAEELPTKVAQQKGSVDAREAERVPSDLPSNQSSLIIHPPSHLKRDLAQRLRIKQAEEALSEEVFSVDDLLDQR